MTEHLYLSTACLHLRHDYCNAAEGDAGPKTPAQCKFCGARCICSCHPETARIQPQGDQEPPAGGIGYAEGAQGHSGAACTRVGLHNCGGEWKNHDVDPGTIPASERITIADGQMTMRQCMLNERGKTIVMDHELVTHVITVPVKVAPPPLVEEWLQPRCPTCGR